MNSCTTEYTKDSNEMTAISSIYQGHTESLSNLDSERSLDIS